MRGMVASADGTELRISVNVNTPLSEYADFFLNEAAGVVTIDYTHSGALSGVAETAFSLSFVELAAPSASASQKELIEIDTYPEDGDVYSITVNGTTVSYTVTSADDVIDVRDSLINAINTDAAINAIVTTNTTSGNLENAIELVADTPGSTGFTSSVFSMPSAHLVMKAES